MDVTHTCGAVWLVQLIAAAPLKSFQNLQNLDLLRYLKTDSHHSTYWKPTGFFPRKNQPFSLVTLPCGEEKNPRQCVAHETKRGAFFVSPRWHPKVPVPVAFGMALPRKVLWLPPMAERGENVGCILLPPPKKKHCGRRGLTLNYSLDFDSQKTVSTNYGTWDQNFHMTTNDQIAK